MDVNRRATTYRNDKPCVHGHTERYVSTNACVECRKVIDARPARVKARLDRDAKTGGRRILASVKKYFSTPRGRVRRLLNNAKTRSKEFGVPFDITMDDISIPDYCPVLGIKLEHGKGVPTGASPTLDRIVPERGYVRGNIVVMSHRANSIKNNAKPEELRQIADWLENALRGANWM